MNGKCNRRDSFLFFVILVLIISLNVFLAESQPLVSTFAGSGAASSTDNQGTFATFNNPSGIKSDSNGNLYIAEASGNKVRKIFTNGTVATIAGSGVAGFNDAQGTAAQFSTPTDLVVDGNGNIFVAEFGGNRIRRIDVNGVVTTWAGSGAATSTDGVGALATLNRPWGIAIDSAGILYVAQTDGSNLVRKIFANRTVVTLAGTGATGFNDGPGSAATFSCMRGITVDASGNLYVLDCPYALPGCKFRMISPSGYVTTLAGGGTTGSVDGQGTSGLMNMAIISTMGSKGNFFIADAYNNAIRQINSTWYLSMFAGSTTPGSGDGVGSQASFKSPGAIVADPFGSLYVSDSGNNKVRKITCQTSPGFFAVASAGCITTPCAPGTFQPLANQIACVSCPLNAICNATSITRCKDGFQFSSNNTNCTACPPGSSSNISVNSCQKCPEGTYQPLPSQIECLRCPSNAVCDRIGAVNFTCTANFVLSVDKLSCELVIISGTSSASLSSTSTSVSSFDSPSVISHATGQPSSRTGWSTTPSQTAAYVSTSIKLAPPPSHKFPSNNFWYSLGIMSMWVSVLIVCVLWFTMLLVGFLVGFGTHLFSSEETKLLIRRDSSNNPQFSQTLSPTANTTAGIESGLSNYRRAFTGNRLHPANDSRQFSSRRTRISSISSSKTHARRSSRR